MMMNKEIDQLPGGMDAGKDEPLFYPRSSLIDVFQGLKDEDFAAFDSRIMNGGRSMAWTDSRQGLVQEEFPDSHALIHPAREKKKLFRRESDGDEEPAWTHVDEIKDMVEEDRNGHIHTGEASIKTPLEDLHLQEPNPLQQEGHLDNKLSNQKNNHGLYGAPYLSPHEMFWTYLDPSGNLQGPFSGIQMHEWYEAGYFPPSLSIRRESGGDFAALTSWISSLGPKPFLVSVASEISPPTNPPPFQALQTANENQQREPLQAQSLDVASYVETQEEDVQKEIEEDTLAQNLQQAVAEEDPPDKVVDATINYDGNADSHVSNSTVNDFMPNPSFAVRPVSPPIVPSAPWAERKASGSLNAPSLKDILTAEEARNALVQKRQNLQAAQAAAVVDPAPVKPKEKPLVVPSVEGKAWSTSTSQPPKSMSQIQREERDAALRLQQQQQQAAKQKTSTGKSFADLAKQSIQPSTVMTGWTTVGEKGKPVSKPVPPLAPAARPPPPKPQPAAARKPNTPAKPNDEGFLTWCVSNLKGLNADVIPSEFITMISSFPVHENPSETVEIVSDMVYAASRTIDGRRFAEEFVRRRREMEKGGWSAILKNGGTPEKKKDEWHGAFKVVERKKGAKKHA